MEITRETKSPELAAAVCRELLALAKREEDTAAAEARSRLTGQLAHRPSSGTAPPRGRSAPTSQGSKRKSARGPTRVETSPSLLAIPTTTTR